MPHVYIGTSGWQYGHWRGNFYPAELPQKEWLRYYSTHLDTVEVNSSFYGQTKASTFEKWKSEVPPGFTFSVKGNRYITHIKSLKNCKEPLENFFKSASGLFNLQPTTHNLQLKHVALWQLPPSLKKDAERFRRFLDILRIFSKPHLMWRHAFEFRHESWMDQEIFGIIEDQKVECSVVIQDWHEWPIIEEPIGKFVYVRFHGKEQLYTSGYQGGELANWAKRMQKWIAAGRDVYAYFNNDAMGHATENALSLKEML
jgi:uncharacterized protein YecE (DUF72 family)